MAEGGFIDVHSHILFSVDDGADSLEKSLEMLKIERSEGAGIVFLTPHYYEGARNSSHVEERFASLKACAKEQVPEIELFLGNEIFCASNPLSAVQSGDARTLGGGKYVLLEFSPREKSDAIRRYVISFLREGFCPVLAHVERYENFFGNNEAIREIVGMGAKLQINCSTFAEAGFFGGRTLRALLREGMIFAAGTDAHDTAHRPPKIKKAYDWVLKNSDKITADGIFRENASEILG